VNNPIFQPGRHPHADRAEGVKKGSGIGFVKVVSYDYNEFGINYTVVLARKCDRSIRKPAAFRVLRHRRCGKLQKCYHMIFLMQP